MMRNLSAIGRIFYGTAIAEIGLQAIYDRDFPYMLMPPNHSAIPGFVVIVAISGVLLMLAGLCIIFGKKTRQAALLLGLVLLMIFCFYYIPYQLFVSPNNKHFGDWENSAKELALAGGAFVIAACYTGKNESSFDRFVEKLIPFGAVLFPITIISFGVDHFLYAKEAAGYVPSWAPYHVFWMYFCGAALLGSGIAIILKIRVQLIAILLGAMILIWFVSLHIPKVVVSSAADLPGEISSAILALAYSGTAFVIAGCTKKVTKREIFATDQKDVEHI
ncbi:MAG: hypothetical protein ACHQHN_14530 [Sphingobacteriales bacterium]